MAESGFEAGGTALLRLPVLTAEHAAVTRLGTDPDHVDPDCAGGSDWAGAFLRRALTDTVLREAIEVSSGSLAGTVDRWERGEPIAAARLRRAAFAVARYVLRMAGRPTPFGLTAGVATTAFGETTKVRLGDSHRKGVRVDGGWLASVLAGLERHPEVMRALRVTTNDLCFVRGDRLVLPYVRAKARELSIRHTPAVAAALNLVADRPLCCAELVRRLGERFPTAATDRIEAMVGALIAQEILLTDLHPPIAATDPLGYVLERLRQIDVPAGRLEELTEVAEALAAYVTEPVGHGVAQWREAARRMRDLQVTERPPIQVDLRVDAEVRLPKAVAAEIERAAGALWRLSPGDATPTYLREYHAAFLERYGTGRQVPVRELLDPEGGLGAPAGYQVPRSSRRDRPAGRPHEDDQDRERLLGALLQEATMTDGEAVLDDTLLDRLVAPAATGPETSMELGVHILARSADALDRGDFRLVVAPVAGHAAGAVFGRFAYLFDDLGYLTDLVEDDREQPQAQVAFRPVDDRNTNVLRVPSVCRRTLAVGVFADRSAPDTLGLNDIRVAADPHRLYLIAADRELRLFSPHMLNTRFATPNAVRLLREIAAFGRREWRPWTWGALAVLPRLPRVRYGRTTLSPARWRPPPGLDERDLAGWCARWRVPSLVHATFADHRLELDLTEPLHRRLLHQELCRRGDVRLVEPPGRPDELGWLDGRAHELVVPLVPARRPSRTDKPRSWHTRPTARPVRYPPGGEWVYAKLYSGTERHEELLTEHLPALRARLATASDGWFFVRYADPEPHLRLRFHGSPADLNEVALPALNNWAGALCGGHMASRLALDTYDPEIERYGGTEVFAAATAVFQTDSEAVLSTIRLRRRGGLDTPDELLAAAGMLDMVRAFGVDVAWVRTAFAKEDEHHRAFQERRQEALRLVDPSRPAAVADDPALCAAWRRRRRAMAAYGRRIRALAAMGRLPVEPTSVLASLLHLHHNRLLGVDRGSEQRSYAVLRGAVQAHHDRARSGS